MLFQTGKKGSIKSETAELHENPGCAKNGQQILPFFESLKIRGKLAAGHLDDWWEWRHRVTKTWDFYKNLIRKHTILGMFKTSAMFLRVMGFMISHELGYVTSILRMAI